MISVFVVGPQYTVVAIWHFVFSYPMIPFDIVTTFCDQAVYESRMSDIKLYPFVIALNCFEID